MKIHLTQENSSCGALKSKNNWEMCCFIFQTSAAGGIVYQLNGVLQLIEAFQHIVLHV